MKQLKVSFLPYLSTTFLNLISDSLDAVSGHRIDIMPWQENEKVPQARFTIAYGEDSVFLKYYIHEKNPRAVYTSPNEPVYKDSCVEFFIAFEGESKYYNFEFNFLGNALVGYGSDGKDRILLPIDVIKKIQAQTVIRLLHGLDSAVVNWELTIVIPFELFHYHKVSSLKGKKCSVNFSKCGDDLPDPHFLTWSNIQTEFPDFHVREFFGEIEFVNDKSLSS
jgi:hypothetical protein